MSNKNIFWIIVVILLLWLLLRGRLTGSGRFSYVGMSADGPVALVEPPVPVMAEIQRELALPWSRLRIL